MSLLKYCLIKQNVKWDFFPMFEPWNLAERFFRWGREVKNISGSFQNSILFFYYGRFESKSPFEFFEQEWNTYMCIGRLSRPVFMRKSGKLIELIIKTGTTAVFSLLRRKLEFLVLNLLFCFIHLATKSNTFIHEKLMISRLHITDS